MLLKGIKDTKDLLVHGNDAKYINKSNFLSSPVLKCFLLLTTNSL